MSYVYNEHILVLHVYTVNNKLNNGDMSNNKFQYHHGDLPSALIEAALKRIAQEGVEKLSLRAVARDIGVSQTAPYRHFKDKTHLLVAIARQGFEMLASQKLLACNDADPIDELIEGGIRYVNFAIANPERYKLMFGSKIENRCDFEDLMSAGQASFRVIVERVERGVAGGLLVKEDPQILAKNCWTTVHGISSLYIDGYLQDMEWSFEEFVRKEITLCIRGILKDASQLDSSFE